MSDAFRFTLANILDGRHRILYAPVTQAVPTHLGNIIDLISPYAPKSGWVDLGGTKDGAVLGRSITKAGYNVQQTSATVASSVQTVERTFTTTAVEYTPALRVLYEESGSGITTVAAGANKSAQKTVAGGSISSLTPWRVAILAWRPKSAGVLTEPSGAVRPGWFGRCYYRMEQGASSGSETFAEGELCSIPLEFESLLEPTITAEGTEGFIDMAEDLGQTISAS